MVGGVAGDAQDAADTPPEGLLGSYHGAVAPVPRPRRATARGLEPRRPGSSHRISLATGTSLSRAAWRSRAPRVHPLAPYIIAPSCLAAGVLACCEHTHRLGARSL